MALELVLEDETLAPKFNPGGPEMPENSMTARAAQRKAPANGETPVYDAEGALLESLDDCSADMLLPGDRGSEKK